MHQLLVPLTFNPLHRLVLLSPHRLQVFQRALIFFRRAFLPAHILFQRTVPNSLFLSEKKLLLLIAAPIVLQKEQHPHYAVVRVTDAPEGRLLAGTQTKLPLHKELNEFAEALDAARLCVLHLHFFKLALESASDFVFIGVREDVRVEVREDEVLCDREVSVIGLFY